MPNQVGDIDLMKKGLRPVSKSHNVYATGLVGDIDLMKKGLRHSLSES